MDYYEVISVDSPESEAWTPILAYSLASAAERFVKNHTEDFSDRFKVLVRGKEEGCGKFLVRTDCHNMFIAEEIYE